MTYLATPAACPPSLSHCLLSLPVPLVPHCLLSPLYQASRSRTAQHPDATIDLELSVPAGPQMLPRASPGPIYWSFCFPSNFQTSLFPVIPSKCPSCYLTEKTGVPGWDTSHHFPSRRLPRSSPAWTLAPGCPPNPSLCPVVQGPLGRQRSALSLNPSVLPSVLPIKAEHRWCLACLLLLCRLPHSACPTISPELSPGPTENRDSAFSCLLCCRRPSEY